MPNDKPLPEQKTVNQQVTGGDCVSRLAVPLPCPFCGHKANHTPGDRSVRQPDRVECGGCYAVIEEEYEPMSALTKWNSRHNDHGEARADNATSPHDQTL